MICGRSVGSFSSWTREKFSDRGARHQGHLAPLRNLRAVSQNGVILLFNRVQYFHAAAAEKIEINREFAVDFPDERQTSMEPVAGTLDFELHHFAKRGRVFVLRDVFFADAEQSQ